jgi:hypothetical protein
MREIIYWNNRTYGSAIRLNKNYLKIVLSVLCLITPCTNWLIPIIYNRIKTDIIMRY